MNLLNAYSVLGTVISILSCLDSAVNDLGRPLTFIKLVGIREHLVSPQQLPIAHIWVTRVNPIVSYVADDLYKMIEFNYVIPQDCPKSAVLK